LGESAAAFQSFADGVRSNTTLQKLDLDFCGLGDQGISILANALASRNTGILELHLRCNRITSAGLHTLLENDAEAVKTLIKLDLRFNPVNSEGATILADALGRNVMPSLRQLRLGRISIEDDGLVALVSALEQNISLQILDLESNDFGERGLVALANSLPNMKGLQQINLEVNTSFQSILPLLDRCC
jgi:Ran GTPase-activating protein (RanGAP) involved in mRNA processing and transport